MTDTKYDDAVETFTRELAWKWEGGSKFRALLATLLRTQVEEALKPVEEERDRLLEKLQEARYDSRCYRAADEHSTETANIWQQRAEQAERENTRLRAELDRLWQQAVAK